MTAGSRRAVVVLGTAGILLATAQIHRVGGGVIAPELVETFQVSSATLGLIMGLMYLASAFTQVPMGLAYDRFGARRTMAAAATIGLAGTVVFALSGSASGLMLGRILLGIGFAGVVTGILLLTMRWAPPDRFATIGGAVLAVANIVGSLVATIPLGGALRSLGWRPTFLMVAAFTGLVILLVLALVRDGPDGREPARSSGSMLENLRAFRRFVADPELRPTLAMGLAAIAPFVCTAGLWAGPYLREVHGLSPTATNGALLAMMLLGNLGALGFGPLDRLFGTRKKVVLGGALVVAVALLALALIPGLSLVPAVMLLFLAVLGSAFYVTLAAHCRAFTADAEAGRMIGILNLTALIGASAAQWLTGLIVDALAEPGAIGSEAGFRAAFGTVALLVILAGALYLRAPDRPPPRA
jgi:MFS family permease